MLGIKFDNLRGDLFGGLTAGVVALPLALAFGEASGAGPIAGLYGAIIVGFFAALFGGTGSQISGPTGPMIVVFAGVFGALSGNPGLVFATVVLAGVIQVGFGIFKLGQYIKLVPYPVVSGFMTGIGCIIIALQASRLFGHEPEGSGTIPAAKMAKIVPPPLAALVIGTLLSTIIAGAPLLGDIPTGLPSFIIPEFRAETILIVFEAAFVLALLGSLDSLLTSLVADNMTRTKHNSNQELIGQGIGNVFAGFFGGIPGAGATMRTVVNIRTGGLTKISGMIHSALLFAVVVSLGPLAAQIPHAVLAGILVKVGYDIVDLAYLKRAHKGPRWDLLLMVLVLILTVFVDLITAVIAGVVLASLAFVKQMADLQLASIKDLEEDLDQLIPSEEEEILKDVADSVTLFDFSGPLSFGAAADLGHHVRLKAKGSSALVIDFLQVPFLDVSAARAVATICQDATEAKKRVFISGMNSKVKQVLIALQEDSVLPEMFYENRQDALKATRDFILAAQKN